MPILTKPKPLFFHLAHFLDPGVHFVGFLRDARDKLSLFLREPRGKTGMEQVGFRFYLLLPSVHNLGSHFCNESEHGMLRGDFDDLDDDRCRND